MQSTSEKCLEQDLEIHHEEPDSRNYEEGLYEHIKNNVSHLKLPRRWMFVIDGNNAIRFLRIESDLTSYLVVSLDSELNIEIHHQNKIVDWMKFEKLKSKTDIEKILEIVNNCIDRSSMFIS